MDDASKAKYLKHVGEHHDGYPQTKDQLVKACNNMSEFDEKEKAWFAEKLPDGNYKSKEEVIEALGL